MVHPKNQHLKFYFFSFILSQNWMNNFLLWNIKEDILRNEKRFVSTVESASMLLGSLQNIFFCVPEVEEKKGQTGLKLYEWEKMTTFSFLSEWTIPLRKQCVIRLFPVHLTLIWCLLVGGINRVIILHLLMTVCVIIMIPNCCCVIRSKGLTFNEM